MAVDRPKAAVIGGSIAGLMSALLLRRAGWQVDVYERVPEPLNGRGAGIVTHEELYEALREAGIPGDTDLGVPVRFRRTFDRDGRLILETRRDQVVTSWDRVFELVRSAFPDEHYHRGKFLTRVENGKDGVRAQFADGTAFDADLLIGADGFRSTVRAQFLPDFQPSYAGYVAWRGLIPEAALSPKTHAEIFEALAFTLPPREQMLGYPVAGPAEDLRPGHRRYNIVWYRPADEHTLFRELLTDSSGRFHSISIAPSLIRPEFIAQLRADSEAVLAPQFAEAVRLIKSPFFQPIYDLETPRMVFGRCVILGDAAFVARPHVAVGVSKAAADALALQRALVKHRNGIEQALAAFEAPRVAMGARFVNRGRQLGAYMQAQLKTPEEREQAERHHTPHAVMAETADLSFLTA
jgi:2-polyprenyl-6-methoxyphenol hydroxylase-like FAD-dependent oxidoreductase